MRSDSPGGPYVAVPQGSAIMSPSQRANPQLTSASGEFHWDVVAGYYKLQASKSGCHAPGSTATTVTSASYEVPPPATGLKLVLNCGEPQIDRMTARDATTATATLRGSPISTAKTNELLVALISVGGPTDASQTLKSVTGGGLTWSRINRSSSKGGAVEVWTAFAKNRVSNLTLSAALSKGKYGGSVTVVAFQHAKSTVGAHAVKTGSTGAPKLVLTAIANKSVIWAVGHNDAVATNVVVAASSTIRHQFADQRAKDTYWSESLRLVTTATKTATVAVTAPKSGRWQLAALEIRTS
jgi:hypothetical protein